MLWQPRLPEEYSKIGEKEIAERIIARKAELGDRLLVLGHHYQQDETIRHADLLGDSRGTEFIVFCGVHFMAETADLLTDESVQVILPDLSAGCSMADMAQWDDVVDCWERLEAIFDGELLVPVTYVNSTAAVKAFVGMHGGACCTSSNAGQVFDWARSQGENARVLFLPDQHLGRNTAHARGITTEVDALASGEKARTALWDPRKHGGGLAAERYRDAEVILWAGHCSVHRLFRPEHVQEARAEDADVKVIVHPECAQEVVDLADLAGSTEYIIRTIDEAEPGTSWAIGTEVHLVSRLARQAIQRDVRVRILSECQCLCTTMYRVDPVHLLFVLDSLAQGTVVNRIQVHPDAAAPARKALRRMLENVDPRPVAVKS
jgi:quinolinate synthase